MLVFGIGLGKTGSTSLATALPMLGYDTLEKVDAVSEISDKESRSQPQGKRYYKITPIARRFKEVDQLFPGAKYILTVRDVDTWLKSCSHHYRVAPEPGTPGEQRVIDLFGVSAYDDASFRRAYDEHLTDVKEHFKNRPQDLLVLNITAGHGWKELCGFLGEKAPRVPFPRENVSKSWGRLWRKVRKKLGLA